MAMSSWWGWGRGEVRTMNNGAVRMVKAMKAVLVRGMLRIPWTERKPNT